MSKLELNLLRHKEVLEEHAETLHVFDDLDEVELLVDTFVTFLEEALELLALLPADTGE